jgi:hypothetical protein
MRHSQLALLPPLMFAWGCHCLGPRCDELEEQLARDKCYYQQLGAAEDASLEAVQLTIGEIDDPLIRSAAVLAWLDAHALEVSPEQAHGLCEVLEWNAYHYCQRRYSTPHMRR